MIVISYWLEWCLILLTCRTIVIINIVWSDYSSTSIYNCSQLLELNKPFLSFICTASFCCNHTTIDVSKWTSFKQKRGTPENGAHQGTRHTHHGAWHTGARGTPGHMAHQSTGHILLCGTPGNVAHQCSAARQGKEHARARGTTGHVVTPGPVAHQDIWYTRSRGTPGHVERQGAWHTHTMTRDTPAHVAHQVTWHSCTNSIILESKLFS